MKLNINVKNEAVTGTKLYVYNPYLFSSLSIQLLYPSLHPHLSLNKNIHK